MSNLRTTTTGLPFIVLISQRDDARHAARVKWLPEPKVDKDNLGSYAVSPFGHKNGPRLSTAEERLLETWIVSNRDVLLDYWDGEIPFTEDAVARLRKV